MPQVGLRCCGRPPEVPTEAGACAAARTPQPELRARARPSRREAGAVQAWHGDGDALGHQAGPRGCCVAHQRLGCQSFAELCRPHGPSCRRPTHSTVALIRARRFPAAPAGWPAPGRRCCCRGSRLGGLCRHLHALLHGSHCVLAAACVAREQLHPPKALPAHLPPPNPQQRSRRKRLCVGHEGLRGEPTFLCPWRLASHLCGGGPRAQPGHADKQAGWEAVSPSTAPNWATWATLRPCAQGQEWPVSQPGRGRPSR